jgi:hypothetical protein
VTIAPARSAACPSSDSPERPSAEGACSFCALIDLPARKVRGQAIRLTPEAAYQLPKGLLDGIEPGQDSVARVGSLMTYDLGIALGASPDLIGFLVSGFDDGAHLLGDQRPGAIGLAPDLN